MATSKTPAAAPAVPPGDAAQAFAAAIEGGRTWCESALRAWGDQAHVFVEGMGRDAAAAFEGLCGCRSPMEALAVEQAWLTARSTAYMDLSQRMLAAALTAAQPPANEGPDFRLPD